MNLSVSAINRRVAEDTEVAEDAEDAEDAELRLRLYREISDISLLLRWVYGDHALLFVTHDLERKRRLVWGEQGAAQQRYEFAVD